MQESVDSSSRSMDKILVHGGYPLSGSIKISGSKNSALPIMAATLLTRDPCVLHRVPDLSDTNYMLQILMHLGADVERASGTVTVKAEKVDSVAPYEVVRKMRASVCVLRSIVRPMQRSNGFVAWRLCHRRSPDRSAPQGL
jgi:UDP-N-acetylglucosamine 1-carboxyvinyltransferase